MSPSAPATTELPQGFRRLALELVASTNDEARRLALDGEAEGLVVTARAQTRGRGRHGRSWVSPEGNLYASLVLRPRCPVAQAAELTFAAALALAEALQALGPPALDVALKWPNDLLIGGRKTAGLLLESAPSAAGLCEWLVVGCGVNIASFPEGLPYPATCLAREGIATTPDALLHAYLAAFAPWLARWRSSGFGPLREAWLARSHGVGAPLRVRLDGYVLEGRFAGLTAAGALRLVDAAGRERRLATGEVLFEAP